MQKESISKDVQTYVGPYKLDKTLGKGQTGTVDQFSRYVAKFQLTLRNDWHILRLQHGLSGVLISQTITNS